MLQIIRKDELSKVSESHIPKSYEELIRFLPEISESLPQEYILRYRYLNEFPVKVHNERSYELLLEEMKRFPGVIFSLLILTKEEDEKQKDARINMISSIFSGQTSGNLDKNLLISEVKEPESCYAASVENKNSVDIPANGVNEVDNDENSLLRDSAEGDNQEGLLQKNKQRRKERKPSRKIESLENIEFVVSEPDALRKGLSDRVKKAVKKETRLQKEVKFLEKGLYSDFSIRDFIPDQYHDDQEEDLEVIEKKTRREPARNMLGDQNEPDFLKLDENIKKFQEKWKNEFSIEADFEKHSLKVETVRRKISRARSKLKVKINDECFAMMWDEFVEAIEVENYSSYKIQNLTLDFRNCVNISKLALEEVFYKISYQFMNVRSLSLHFDYTYIFDPLDYHFFQHYDEKTLFIELERTLTLKYLQKLTLNFFNRQDISYQDLMTIVESLGECSKSLKSFIFILPGYGQPEEFEEEISRELAFVNKIKVLPKISTTFMNKKSRNLFC